METHCCSRSSPDTLPWLLVEALLSICSYVQRAFLTRLAYKFASSGKHEQKMYATHMILAAVFSKIQNHAFSGPEYQIVHTSSVGFIFFQIFNKVILSLKLEPQINCQQLLLTRVSDSRTPCAMENRQKVHFFPQLEAK